MRNVSVTLAWLTHPVSAVAVLVLLVNDRLLKAAAPGVVTGKLSDVAGLVFAPALVAAVCCLLVPRLPARWAAAGSTVLVGAAFAVVKAVPGGADVASAAWSVIRPSTILADPTDLLALPALGIAWWVRGRTLTPVVSASIARGVRAAVVLPFAVLGVAATSAPYYSAVDRVVVVDGQVRVLRYNAFHGLPDGPGDLADAAATVDGTTWTALKEPVTPDLPPRATSACVPDRPDVCYRVVPGRLAVEESTDAGRTWRMSWQVTEGRRTFLARGDSDLRSPREHLSAADIAILPAAGGYRVFVANRRDGIAIRQPDGAWQRIGLPYAGGVEPPAPLTAPGKHVWAEYALAVAIGSALYVLGLLPALSRRRVLAGFAAGTTVLGAIIAALAQLVGSFLDIGFTLIGMGVGLAGLVWWIATVAGDPRPRPWLWPAQAALAVTAAAGVIATFYGWSAGHPDAYSTAAGIAGAVTGTAVAGTVVLVLFGRGPAARPEPEPEWTTNGG
ncbi:hypothetical protein [Dactylosporangium sp. NPDC000521]|uniref:hypothetical protein n=1 Tax=Dactylosporangium sp. NPDC000521 TaxID=3363975 RepID=UPI0036B340F3